MWNEYPGWGANPAGLINGPYICESAPMPTLSRWPRSLACLALPCVACHNMPALLPSCCLLALLARLASSYFAVHAGQPASQPGLGDAVWNRNLAHLHMELVCQVLQRCHIQRCKWEWFFSALPFCTLRGSP